MLDHDSLNEEQRAAVRHGDGPSAVYAGPGSGKTRVVALRAARLAAAGKRLLVTTFTNDATSEMRERIEALLQTGGAGAADVTTMHALCLRILRETGAKFGLLTDETMRRGLAETAKAGELETGIAGFLTQASYQKSVGVTAPAYKHDGSSEDMDFARAWRAYEKLKTERGLREFDDLIVDVLKLLETDTEVRERVAARYDHVIVDECQDMNAPQYGVAFALASTHKNVMLVGDPDQSLYAFRGADTQTFRRFAAHRQTKVFELRSNYRSSAAILRFADSLIRQDVNRRQITLAPTRGEGDPVSWTRWPDPDLEAIGIGASILDLVKRGAHFREIAVLYRTNAQSEAFERHFAALEIPYTIKEDGDFYSRKEIRGMLAYLRFFGAPISAHAEPGASGAFADEWLLALLNTPNRKMPKSIGSEMRHWADLRGKTIWQTLPEFQAGDLKAHRAVRTLTQELKRIEEKLGCIPNAGEAVRVVRAVTDFDGWLRRSEQNEKDNDRIQNLQRMQAAATHYPTIAEYLAAVDKIRDEASRRKSERARRKRERDEVTLGTGHSAKGLEWRFVFAAGWSEELLPHRKADDIDEERRVAYVIATRARDVLTVSSIDSWNDSVVAPSRFLTGLQLVPTTRTAEVPEQPEIQPDEISAVALGGLFIP